MLVYKENKREIVSHRSLRYIYLNVRLPDAGGREESLGSCESARCLGMNSDDMGSFFVPLAIFGGELERVDWRRGSWGDCLGGGEEAGGDEDSATGEVDCVCGLGADDFRYTTVFSVMGAVGCIPKDNDGF